MNWLAGNPLRRAGRSAPDASSPASGLSSLFRKKRERFATTRWTLVVQAGEEATDAVRSALEQLCQDYWYPLYAYVRRRGYPAHEAEDLTQEFFCQILKNDSLARANPELGRFRSYLLGAMKHFLAHEWRKQGAQKRGNHATVFSLDADWAEQRFEAEPVDLATPEALYERRWAWTLIEQTLEALEREMADKKDLATFEALKGFITFAPDREGIAAVAERLKRREGATRVLIHRLRKRFRGLLRARVADTVEDGADVDAELQDILTRL